MSGVYNVFQTKAGTQSALISAPHALMNEHKVWSDMTTPEKFLKIVTFGLYSPRFSLAEKTDASLLMSHFRPYENRQFCAQPDLSQPVVPFAYANVGDTQIICSWTQDDTIEVSCTEHKELHSLSRFTLDKEQSANLLRALPPGAYDTHAMSVDICIPSLSLPAAMTDDDYLKAARNIPTAITGSVTDNPSTAFNSVWVDAYRSLSQNTTRVVIDDVHIPPLVMKAYLSASGITGAREVIPVSADLSEVNKQYKQLSAQQSDISTDVMSVLDRLNQNTALRAGLFSSSFQSLWVNEGNSESYGKLNNTGTGTESVIHRKIRDHRDITITTNNDGISLANNNQSCTVQSNIYLFKLDPETELNVKCLKWRADYPVPSNMEPTIESMRILMEPNQGSIIGSCATIQFGDNI